MDLFKKKRTFSPLGSPLDIAFFENAFFLKQILFPPFRRFPLRTYKGTQEAKGKKGGFPYQMSFLATSGPPYALPGKPLEASKFVYKG